MKLSAPKINQQNFLELLRKARSMAPFYTPEWDAQREKEPGVALLKIYLNMYEQIIGRLNETPHKNLVAFLDMMGIKMLPAQSATAPITFTLTEGTSIGVPVLKGTQLAGTGKNAAGEDEEVIFQTEKTVLVSPATLQEIISVDSPNDKFYQHTQAFKDKATFPILFGEDQQEHSLYLAHADLFTQERPTEILVNFNLSAGASATKQLDFVWEYWNGNLWASLADLKVRQDGTSSEQTNPVDLGTSPELDKTEEFQRSGTMSLRKEHSGAIEPRVVSGEENRWIRCRLKNTLTAISPIKLPSINSIRISVNPIQPFPPDLVFNNDIPIDITPIKVSMLAIEVPLSLDYSSPPGDPCLELKPAAIQSPVPPNSHGIQIPFVDTSALEKGDILEFDNLENHPVRVKVLDIDHPTPNIVVVGSQTLLGDESGDQVLPDGYSCKLPTEVKMITAIRAESNLMQPIKVLAESLEGVSINVGDKVVLRSGQSSEAANIARIPSPEIFSPVQEDSEPKYIISLNMEEDESQDKNVNAYVQGDTLRIIPQIKPFGTLPVLFDTFYIASNEALSKKGAEITLEIESKWNDIGPNTSPPPISKDPTAIISWEYWNGNGWRIIQVVDTTDRFKNNGEIRFTCPEDIELIEVNGEEKYWIRARIVDGDFGQEFFIEPRNQDEVEVRRQIIQYPIIKDLNITYSDVQQIPQKCVTYNNLTFEDQSEICKDEDRVFQPFRIFPDQYPGLFLGFDKPLVGGPLRMLFDLQEIFLFEASQGFRLNDQSFRGLRSEELAPEILEELQGLKNQVFIGENRFVDILRKTIGEQNMLLLKDTILGHAEELFLSENDQLKMQWHYWNGSDWVLLNVSDGSQSLTKIGVLEWAGGPDFKEQQLFGKKHYWLKGSVVEGKHTVPPQINGIHLNTTTAFQASPVVGEILGASNGTADQTFNFLKQLIISQDVWVREPRLPGEGAQELIHQEEGQDAIKIVRDEAGEEKEIWIRWHEVADFDKSGVDSRHYLMNNRLGIIQFGDGEKGMVPPPGADGIKVDYRYGGGTIGNIAKNSISGLKNAIPFIKEAVNHLDGDGGAETETLEQVLERGPQQLKNRNRAVTSEDFEWMARNVSRKVARAKCLPNRDDNGDFVPGWVTVLILPDSEEDKPEPTRQLIEEVTEGLLALSANNVAAPNQIYVRRAKFIEVVVEATIIPTTIDAAATLESSARQRLKEYLNPLTGGARKSGWEFGAPICLSDIFALLESIEEVNAVPHLRIVADGKAVERDLVLDAYTLPYSGDHVIGLEFAFDENNGVLMQTLSDCQDS